MQRKNKTRKNRSGKGSDGNLDSKKIASSKSKDTRDHCEGNERRSTGNKRSYQRDYDVDETDIDQPKNEYKDYSPPMTRDNL